MSGPAARTETTFITFYSELEAPTDCPRKYGIDWLLKQETTGPTPLLARLPMARRERRGSQSKSGDPKPKPRGKEFREWRREEEYKISIAS